MAGIGRRLKAFSFNVNTIIERGAYDTGIEDAIQNLAVLGSDIWIVTTLGEVFRTDTSLMGSQPVWEEVVLPMVFFPCGLAVVLMLYLYWLGIELWFLMLTGSLYCGGVVWMI